MVLTTWLRIEWYKASLVDGPIRGAGHLRAILIGIQSLGDDFLTDGDYTGTAITLSPHPPRSRVVESGRGRIDILRYLDIKVTEKSKCALKPLLV